ncbi:MAG: hypothetical protein H7330_16820 [Hymenobacteraceae bacterium]|nr:hypothetical protein [Hymenobacteraceae bacterium]
MQLLRKLVLLLAMAYFLFLVLVITNLVSVAFLDDQFSHFNPSNFFKMLTVIGAALLAAALAVEQSHAALLRRRVVQLEGSVAELKSNLYDAQQRAMTDALRTPSATGPVVPPRTSLPGEMK